MNDLADRFFEVVMEPDKLAAADALEPIYTRELLGKKSCVFEDVPRQQLEPLGEVLTPTVADLFVAKMKEAHHDG